MGWRPRYPPKTGAVAIRILRTNSYFSGMPKTPYAPCIPTRGKTVPAGPDWIHEIKHDGFRLIVQREGQRVRLFTRNGHDWTDRWQQAPRRRDAVRNDQQMLGRIGHIAS